MTIAPYLSFNGQCREAMTFYLKVFAGRDLNVMTYGENPMPGMDPKMTDRVMHSDLSIDDALLMGADSPMGQDQQAGNISVMHDPKDIEDARAKFDALAEGGQVTMPLQETSWSPGFGMVIDRFGIHWMFSTAPKPG